MSCCPGFPSAHRPAKSMAGSPGLARSPPAAAARPKAGKGSGACDLRVPPIPNLMRPLVSFFLADVCVERGQFNIFQRSCARKQIESLKHKSNLAIADRRQLLLREPRYLNSFQQVATRARLVQAADDIHERRFPAAARTHDGGEFSAIDLQGNSTQCMHPRFTQ